MDPTQVTVADANSSIVLFMIQNNLILPTALSASYNTKHINLLIWAIIVRTVDYKMLSSLAWYSLTWHTVISAIPSAKVVDLFQPQNVLNVEQQKV